MVMMAEGISCLVVNFGRTRIDALAFDTSDHMNANISNFSIFAE